MFDGVVDHRGVWYQDNLDQDVAFEKTIKVYFDWVAKNDAVYHLGNSGDDVEKLFYTAARPARAHPRGGKIGPSELTDIFLQAGYYVSGWADIAAAFSKWVNNGDAAALSPLRRHRPRSGDDNGYAIYLAVQCTDTPWPQVRQGARRQLAGCAQGAVRDLGQRLVQRAVPDLAGAPGKPVAVERRGRAADPADQRDARRRHAVLRRAGGPPAVPTLGARSRASAARPTPARCRASPARTTPSPPTSRRARCPRGVAGDRSDKQCPPVEPPTAKAPTP